MRIVCVALAFVVVGCGSQATAASSRTLPDPVVEAEMPEEVERPEGGVRTQAVDSCLVGEGEDAQETGPGILFDQDSAMYVARLRVGYDEVRGLYDVDQRTWARERQVYQRHLELGDEEIERANERAERSWWEKHGDEVGLITGFVVGVAVTVGITAAIDKVTE
jgi:hypothetical protein